MDEQDLIKPDTNRKSLAVEINKTSLTKNYKLHLE